MSDRQALLTEAEDLGIEFPSNIKTTKLAKLVSEAGGTPFVEPVEEVKESATEKPVPQTKAQRIKAAKAKAFKTRVVTLTNKDSRESDEVTTAYLSFENQHFGLAKVVPLDMAVELEQGLISVAESAIITLHKAEYVDGKRTGGHVPTSVKKYSIQYEENS